MTFLCQPGVGGSDCSACLPSFYGFSQTGCLRKKNKFMPSFNHLCNSFRLIIACQCSVDLSETSSCDVVTGQCRCKVSAVGQRCDRCAVSNCSCTAAPKICENFSQHNFFSRFSQTTGCPEVDVSPAVVIRVDRTITSVTSGVVSVGANLG